MPRKVFATASVDEACARGRRVLETYSRRCSNPAAVFDVDETLLLNHPSDDGRYRPNRPVVKLYNQAEELGVKRYVVTARRKSDWSQSYLRRQLRDIGVAEPERIYMVPRAYDDDRSASRFKRDARLRIARKHGAQILLNVGDQASDMYDTAVRANVEFTRRLTPSLSYGIVTGSGDPAFVSLKLPATYHVA